MTERIYIQVDDRELTALTAKLDSSIVRVRRLNVDAGKLDARTKALLPILREANMLSRQLEAISKAAEAAVKAPGIAGVAGIGAALAGLVIALKMIERRIKQIEIDIIRSRGGLENMVREGLDLTHEEYLAMEAEQTGYATAFDEFKAKWDAGEHLDAIADYVIALIPSRIPTYAGRLPYDPTTLPPEVEEHWLKKLDEMLTDWWKNLWRDTGKTNEDTDYEYNMNIGEPYA